MQRHVHRLQAARDEGLLAALGKARGQAGRLFEAMDVEGHGELSCRAFQHAAEVVHIYIHVCVCVCVCVCGERERERERET